MLIEKLETRTLFNGVIMMATGRLGGTNGWIQTQANEITAKLGGAAQVPEYVLSINADPNTGNLVPGFNHVSGTGTPQTSKSGEIIVIVDYYNISANSSYSTVAIGQTLANYMLATPVDGVLLPQLPIHEVGVSRGTGIMDQISNTLGQAGVWVDQETNLDPNPIGVMGDPPTALYDNVEFMDNYWRNDGSASQINDGHAVTGAYNLNVYWLDANSSGYVTPHLAPAGYYNGTIDQNATNGGDGPIYSNWYGNTPTMPARNATGYIYTNLVGAARPLSGVWAASGGSGTRTATGQQGSQWGNIADITITSGSTVSAGGSITASYIHQDRDSADTITFFLDTDRNPYNSFAATLGSVNVAQTTSTTKSTSTLSTSGVSPGTYWLGAKVTDAQGHTRYEYNSVASPLTVQGVPGSGSLAGSKITAPSSYNLTSLGSSDWAHWGRGSTYGNFDHKATGGSQISNVSVVGAGANFGGYSDPSRNATWTDGTPTGSDTNEQGYIWSNGAVNSGYSFTVPADTTTRTLTVYAGGININSSLTAHLSDGSAADVVLTAGQSGLYTNSYTITYHAGSANQSLTLTLLKTGNIVGTSGSADLIAATLSAGQAADTTPPTATLQNSSTITSSSAAETLTVVYSDNKAVKASSLATGNLTLSGPTSQTATFVSATPSGDNATITATYSVAAPSGGWTTAANGTYTVSLAGSSVSDTSNNFAAAKTLGSFQVAIASAGGGSLAGGEAAAPTSYNLTSLGSSDWAHWGRGSTYGNFDHKATGGSQISNVSVVGAGANFGGYSDPSRNATWTDGTPTGSDTNEQGYIWSNGAVNSGYSFTVPADTTTRTLTVYAGGININSSLTAHLSDGSAADVVLTAGQSGLYTNSYTITYHAGSANQSLTLTLLKTGNIVGTSGSVDLIAATLAASQPASGGSLSGVQSVPASSYNLTTLGATDWAHWGRGSVYGNFDHKATGGSKISNVTVLGSGSVGGYSDPSRAVTWTDGTPTSTDSADNGYIWANSAIGAGYSFTVPADTTTRTLYVYAGGYSSGGTLTAHLSDGSSADYVATASGNALYTNLYTITYRAGSAGQTLTLSYVKSSNINGTSGSVDLIAAALA